MYISQMATCMPWKLPSSVCRVYNGGRVGVIVLGGWEAVRFDGPSLSLSAPAMRAFSARRCRQRRALFSHVTRFFFYSLINPYLI